MENAHDGRVESCVSSSSSSAPCASSWAGNRSSVRIFDSGTTQQKGKYDLFIKSFGTHYVAGADFGAHCEFSTAAAKSFVSSKSTEYVKEQMGISIGLQMGGIGIDLDLGYATIASAIKQDAAFKLHAQSVHSCFGGDTTLLSQNPPRYDEWRKQSTAA